MAKQYFKLGEWKYEVDFYSIIENGKIEVSVRKYKDGWAIGIWSTHHLKVGYRPERTWDDHMGNTPCGYYVNLPIGNGKHKRVYVY